MKIRFNRTFARNGWELFVFDETTTSAIPFEIKITRGPEVVEGGEIPVAAYLNRLEMDAFKTAMIDALCEAGFLATQGSTEAELKATKGHLADLQKAFQVLLNRFESEGAK